MMESTLCIKVKTYVNTLDDTLGKSDAQVNIYPKLLLIKPNPVVFLLIAKGKLVWNAQSLVGGGYLSNVTYLSLSLLWKNVHA